MGKLLLTAFALGLASLDSHRSTHSFLRRKVQRADYEPHTVARYESPEPHEAPSQVSLHSLLDGSTVDERP